MLGQVAITVLRDLSISLPRLLTRNRINLLMMVGHFLLQATFITYIIYHTVVGTLPVALMSTPPFIVDILNHVILQAWVVHTGVIIWGEGKVWRIWQIAHMIRQTKLDLLIRPIFLSPNAQEESIR